MALSTPRLNTFITDRKLGLNKEEERGAKNDSESETENEVKCWEKHSVDSAIFYHYLDSIHTAGFGLQTQVQISFKIQWNADHENQQMSIIIWKTFSLRDSVDFGHDSICKTSKLWWLVWVLEC